MNSEIDWKCLDDVTVLSHYHRTRNNAIHLLWRPHLVIYLDVPAAEVRRRIEARNRPHEVDSPVSTTQYLQTLEDVYKKDYLKTIRSVSAFPILVQRCPLAERILV